MKRTGLRTHGWRTHGWLATLALGALVAVAPAGAQSPNTMGAQSPNTMPPPQNQDQDSDLTRQQLSAFDRFLDGHPELAEQLRKDPSLVNSQEFVANHVDLQQYLQEHPEVREELNQNPNAVMHQEQRFDRREDQRLDRDGDRDRDRDRDRDFNRDRSDHDMTQRQISNLNQFLDNHPEIEEQLRKDPSLADNKKFVDSHPALEEFLESHPGVRDELRENPTAFMNREERFDERKDRLNARGELSNMDQFLDKHPEIAEQLRKNPSLADNKKFMDSHPALEEFLETHPGVRDELKENPNAFMNREQNFDQHENRPDRDVTRRELANMDGFMDSHPEIAEQLRKNPALVDNKQFVQGHPALQDFLASHPGVREEYKENPTGFMSQEQRFDQRHDSVMHRDNDVTRGELSSFHEFLEGHGNISGELSKNPSLATNQEYLENHPALRTYLQSHPRVHEELGENPQSFLKSAQHFDTTTRNKTAPKPMADTKMK